jgi:hypothetical protein
VCRAGIPGSEHGHASARVMLTMYLDNVHNVRGCPGVDVDQPENVLVLCVFSCWRTRACFKMIIIMSEFDSSANHFCSVRDVTIALHIGPYYGYHTGQLQIMILKQDGPISSHVVFTIVPTLTCLNMNLSNIWILSFILTDEYVFNCIMLNRTTNNC